MDISCAILAGGKSRRMGLDKHYLKIGEEFLIERVIRKAKAVFDRVFLVSKDNGLFSFGLPLVRDFWPFQAPVVGIASALLQVETDSVFILASDMPFLREEGMLYLIERSAGEDILIPMMEKGVEPLHAIYKRSCLPYILRNIERGIFSISALFPYLSVRVFRDDKVFLWNGISVFTNVNTKEDLEFARRIVGDDNL